MASPGGYACLRKSNLGIFKEAYGKITIPSSYAGICPGDIDPSRGSENTVPELFFGIYTDIGGFDAGVRVGYGGGWRPFIYGNTPATNDGDGDFFSTSAVSPGTLLYMRTWVEKVGSGYVAKLNVSKTGYYGTDLMRTPFSVTATPAFGQKVLGAGAEINREISLASNNGTYETSGCYMTNAKWGDCGMVTNNNTTYIFNDENSKAQSGAGAISGGSSKKVLQLRKDGGTYSASRIKLISATNSSSGASETVSIDFRPTPQI